MVARSARGGSAFGVKGGDADFRRVREGTFSGALTGNAVRIGGRTAMSPRSPGEEWFLISQGLALLAAFRWFSLAPWPNDIRAYGAGRGEHAAHGRGALLGVWGLLGVEGASRSRGGSRTWIRTTIQGFKVPCPAFRRCGKEAGVFLSARGCKSTAERQAATLRRVFGTRERDRRRTSPRPGRCPGGCRGPN